MLLGINEMQENKTNHNAVTMDEYREMLSKHIWAFRTKTYFDFCKSNREENKLFILAVQHGPWFVDEFRYAKDRAMDQIVSAIVDRVKKEQYDYFEDHVRTGDDDFDDFRRRVRNHDWYHSFSDDMSVRNAGERNYQKLSAEAKEKGGIYAKYLQLRCKVYSDSI